MRLFVNRETRVFCLAAAACIAVFLVFSGFMLAVLPENAVYVIWVGALAVMLFMAGAFLVYENRRQRIIERARMQIVEYLAGNERARIACDEEGGLYRLFHEVNVMAAVLNAHAEREERSKEFLRDTISDISHQLKTPLAALSIYNDIIRQEAGTAETVSEFAGLCEEELERIGTLVQSLLKIAKLDAGMIVPEKREVAIADLAERVKRRFAWRAAQEEKELAFSGGEEITLLCDALWMTEAVDNLVKNALDHTKPGDVISLSWDVRADHVQLAVSDNGCGIHPEDLYHIFKRFYRSRFGEETQGVGLGLPLAKAIVEAHGGMIEVDSTPGVGTTFVVTF